MPDNFAAPVPAAVKAAAEQADAIQQDYIRQMNGEEPPQEGEEQQEEQQEGQQEEQQEEEQEELTPEQQAEQEQHFREQQEQQPEEISEDSWEHRYRSLHGRYQSEMPRLRQQIQQLMGQVTNLNKVLSTVSRPAPQAAETTFKSLVKPEEVAEYGDDFVDLVGRIVKDTTGREINALKNQVKHVGSQIGASARERMMTQLAQDVPDWEAINTHQDFLDWLALPDVYSGDIRHNMLSAAFERNDAPRVIAFFKGFLAEMAAVAPPEQEPSRKAVRLNKTPLRNLAAPGRARSTAPAPRAPVEKPIITASQIAGFYTDKTLGKWKGREKEAADIEAQIFAAQAEGRIR